MPKTLTAILTLAGMIIGVGVFALPYSFYLAGFWLGVVELLVLAGVVLFFHLLYADIILKTDHYHRLPGYVALYIGSKSARLAWISAVLGALGSLLVYLIVGSTFLENIFGSMWSAGADRFFWVFVMAAVGALIVSFPLRKESLINGFLTIFLVLFLLLLIFWLAPKTEIANLSGFKLPEFFAPYGVVLFSLSGGVVIPEVVTLVNKHRGAARKAVIVGSLLPALLYLFFVAAVLGVSGSAVSTEAIAGLRPFVGEGVLLLGSVIGFLAIFTSYVAAGKNFQALLNLDLGISPKIAWILVSVLPLFLYILGFQNFVAVMTFVGAVAIGIDSLLIMSAHYKMYKKEGKILPLWSKIWRILLYALVLAGIWREIW